MRAVSATSGVLLLDKPAGLSSSQALQRVRRLLGGIKAGHTGALDPLATGMLPLCFGEATRIAGILLASRKAYRAVVLLGQRTDTDDAEGRVIAQRPVPLLTEDAVDAALAGFTGCVRQVPPAYSALKQEGQPLYRRARRGEAVQAPEREVVVHLLRRVGFESPRLSLEIECGTGFYVRALARDLGETLGCGAHLTALRRLWVEPFRGHAMIGLPQLEAMHAAGEAAALQMQLMDIPAALAHWPQRRLHGSDAAAIRHGRAIAAPADLPDGGCLLLDALGAPLALARAQAGMLRVLRGFGHADAPGAESCPASRLLPHPRHG